ncbi:MAG: glycogen/starch synthase [Amoebophilaceae bacterium]|jgi:starch synthase|nr:glycogen/starch synthase [Amoebophilaceae bacterium]
MSKLRVLYAASEISPFLTTSSVADFTRALPQHMQEKGIEIRILVPRFGLINERRNRLHEVLRLSGINITVSDDAKPLVIKVASIPNAKLQVYFIDNTDYFKRKAIFHDKDNNFFEDNDDRTIFFCKGVLETVKKLGWAPDIIHCHDWITSLIPMYLKTAYRDDPILRETRTVFTIYNNTFSYKFGEYFTEKVKIKGIAQEKLTPLASADFGGLIRAGVEYADAITRSETLQDDHFKGLLDEQYLALIENNEAGLDAYYDLYKKLATTVR